MGQLVSSSQNMKTSSTYIGYLILKMFDKTKRDKISIYNVAEELKKENISSSRQLLFGLTFLYSTGIIKFEEPYIRIER